MKPHLALVLLSIPALCLKGVSSIDPAMKSYKARRERLEVDTRAQRLEFARVLAQRN